MTDPSHATAWFRIPAMDCPEEFHLIRRGLRGRAGIDQISPDYLSRRLRVQFDPGQLIPAEIAAAITELGFPAHHLDRPDVPGAPPRRRVRITTVVGGVLLAAAVAAWWTLGSTTTLVATLATLSAVSSSVPVVRAAWRALRLRSMDMNVLMTIAAVGAVATGEYFDAAAAMFLFGISLWLEGFSISRANRAVRSLVGLTPSVAHRIAENGVDLSGDAAADPASQSPQLVDVDPSELEVGDRCLVRPGERVPVDGEVLSGSSAVNEAPITGESIPVEKLAGSEVFAGSLNGEGSLAIRATRRADQSTLAHIGRLVEQAQASRSRTEQFIDRFARRYTPAVIVLAVLLAAGPSVLSEWGVAWAAAVEPVEWLRRSLVLLVIACPCALVISTPVTIVCGLYAGTRRGMLIKGGEHLESAGRITSIAIDKTGTLTTGRMEVVRVVAAEDGRQDDVLRMAAALEVHSEHPLAAAITRAAADRGLNLDAVRDFTTLRGFGVRGEIEGQTYFVGNARLYGQDHPARCVAGNDAAAGATAALVGTGRAWLGTIYLADRPRDDAQRAVAELQRMGVRPVVMLTGDSRQAAQAIAGQLNIDQVRAELLPEDKVTCVGELTRRYEHLAMVGDGVNDAPALAASRLGIALGSGASDVALETADVVVMSPHLMRIVDLLRLGRRCRRRLRENIAFALAAKLAVLVLAAVGWADLGMAVAADVGTSVLVIFNGMRLIRMG